MIATTLEGGPVWLLEDQPDWSRGMRGRFQLPMDTTRASLQNIEERQGRGQTLRIGFEFTLLLDARGARRLRTGLAEAEGHPVLVPFWPALAGIYDGMVDGTPAGGYYRAAGNGPYAGTGSAEPAYIRSGGPPPLAGRWYLTYEPDGNVWEIHDSAMPEGFVPSGEALKVPLLRGFIASSTVVAETDEWVRVEIRFEEASPAEEAIHLNYQDFAVGPSLESGAQASLFPLEPDWAKRQQPGNPRVDIDRERIGAGREPATIYYPQNARRGGEAAFTLLDWSETARLLRFFHDRQRAGGEAFWMSGAVAQGRLAETLVAGQERMRVDDLEAAAGPVYWWVSGSGRSAVFRRDGDASALPGDVPLTEPATHTFRQWESRLSEALLVRFATAELTIDWNGNGLSAARVAFEEVPPEYFMSGVGPRPVQAFLYRFVFEHPEGEEVQRFTGYERNLSYQGESYTVGPFEHGSIEEGLNLDDGALSVRSRHFAGNPFSRFLPFGVEAPLRVEVLEASVDSAGAVVEALPRFRGSIHQVSFDGPRIEAEARPWGRILDQSFPRMRVQPTCNYALFSTPCGLLRTNWEWSGVIAAGATTGEIPVENLASPNGAVLSADFFRFGWIEWGTGESRIRRFVTGNTAPVGDRLGVAVSPPLPEVPSAGIGIRLYPGCDQRFSTCRNKFANGDSFGGFPHLPLGNPSLVPVERTYGTGGKK